LREESKLILRRNKVDVFAAQGSRVKEGEKEDTKFERGREVI
jgi:hypothetical protein